MKASMPFGCGLRALLLSTCIAPFAAGALAAPPDRARNADLDRLVADVCAKDVVLLGEDANHGSGTTLTTKVEIVERLVGRCGFSALLFESSIYDFFDLEHAFAQHTASAAQLADAIGGLWSTTREADALIAYLFDAANAGTLRVGGIDPQLGSATGLYSQRHLADDLSVNLHGARRESCRAEIDRLANWRYEHDEDYDDGVRARLRACATDVERAAARSSRTTSADATAVMAANLRRYLQQASDANVRDRAMFDNLEWYRARLGRGAKVVVWCATVHAAKDEIPGRRGSVPMGAYVHRRIGERAAAIGFSALAGAFAPLGAAAVPLAPAAPDSLERRVLDAAGPDLRYADRRRLEALGAIEAHAIDYRRATTANWARLLDGLVVLREERPVVRAYAARPRQLDEAAAAKPK